MKINVSLIIVVLACAATASASMRIGVLTDGESEFWTTMNNAMRDAVKEQDIEIDFRMTSPATAEQQEKLAREMMAAGAQALAIAPISPEEQAPLLGEIAGKVPLVTLMRDVPESKRAAFLGRDAKQVGQLLGQEVLRFIPPGMRVIAFCKELEAADTQARIAGLKEAFEASETVLDDTKSDKGDRMIALATMEEIIQKRPEIVAFIGFEPYQVPAMVRAVTESNRARMVRIVGFGVIPEVETAMKDGTVHALVSDDVSGWGDTALKVLIALAKNETGCIPENGFIAAPIKTFQTEDSMTLEDVMNELQVQTPWISEVTLGTP